MKRHVKQNSVPDFLEDSPFLPVGSPDDKFYAKRVAPKKPTISEVIRHKRTRQVAIVVAIFFLFSLIYRTAVRRWFSGPRCLQTLPINPQLLYPPTENFDWSQFAYAQYVTNIDYLCNSVMTFEALHRLGSKADRLMLYPSSFELKGSSIQSELLRKANKEYGVKLVPVEVVRKDNNYHVWAESFTKLLTFNQTQYKRLLVLDSDSTLLKHMDELFFVSSCTAAMPRAYWLDNPYLSSQFMLIQPSATEFHRIQQAIDKAKYGIYDMEVVNKLYGSNCMVLPHQKYNLVTGEFRSKNHKKFHGKKNWDPVVAIREASFVHFSDYPFPKPWVSATWRQVERTQPDCELGDGSPEDCQARYIWLDLYEDFQERRKSVCGLEPGEDPMH